MKIKKITARLPPLIRYTIIPLTIEEKECIIDSFFKGSYIECYNKESSIELYKKKSKISLACDSLTIDKIDITQVINNCGLNVGEYFRVTKTINNQYATRYETEYYKKV